MGRKKNSFGRTSIIVRKYIFYFNRFFAHSRTNTKSNRIAVDGEVKANQLHGEVKVPPLGQELSICDLSVFTALKLQCESDDLIPLQPVINSIYKIYFVRSKSILSMASRWYTVMGHSIKEFETQSGFCSFLKD